MNNNNLNINPNNNLSNHNDSQQSHNQHIMIEEEEEEMTLMDQFKQQMLKAWQPVPTLTKTIILFFIMAAIFLGIGIPMMVLSTDIVQAEIRYDNLNMCAIGSTCNVTLSVLNPLTAPVFVYYGLNNFYQNHRLYAKSYDPDQLAGSILNPSSISTTCDPIIYNNQLWIKNSVFDNTPLDQSAAANPCGLIAYTIFNDSFVVYQNPSTTYNILSTGIAWPSDLEKYKITNKSQMWLDTTNERFMNWMRIAAMPDFRKLWGRIQTDIPAGNYTVQITNNYDVSKIQGQKYFVLATSNFFGSKSQFLSITYIVVGSLCLLIGLLFLLKKLSKKTKIF